MTSSPPDRFQRIGVLDIGSNSVRFVIFELFGSAFTGIYNEKVLAGLGRDLSTTGRLNPQGKDDTLKALKRFKLMAETKNLDQLLVGATAAMRTAKDAPEFIHKVKRQTGIDISPVSGNDEAKLTALGLIASEPRADGIAADLGGASLELIQINQGEYGHGVSHRVGPFEMVGHDLASEDHFHVEAIRAKVNKVMSAQASNFDRGQDLYLIGGAWRNLAGIHQDRHLYPLKTLQAYALMPGAAKDLAQWAYGPGRVDLLNWPDVSQRRAETLPYAGLLLDMLLDKFEPRKVIISAAGLRQGLVFRAMPDELKSRDSLLDGCRDLARGNIQGAPFAQPLIHFLEPAEAAFPKVFEPDNERRIRQAACHLVGIGKGLHPDYRADLVFNNVLYAPLSGLTHKERAYLALILYHSYTSKSNYSNADAMNLLLTLREREAALHYGSAIRLGVVASGRTPELLEHYALQFSKGQLILQVERAHKMLVTERVQNRLTKLCSQLGLNGKIKS